MIGTKHQNLHAKKDIETSQSHQAHTTPIRRIEEATVKEHRKEERKESRRITSPDKYIVPKHERHGEIVVNKIRAGKFFY